MKIKTAAIVILILSIVIVPSSWAAVARKTGTIVKLWENFAPAFSSKAVVVNDFSGDQKRDIFKMIDDPLQPPGVPYIQRKTVNGVTGIDSGVSYSNDWTHDRAVDIAVIDNGGKVVVGGTNVRIIDSADPNNEIHVYTLFGVSKVLPVTYSAGTRIVALAGSELHLISKDGLLIGKYSLCSSLCAENWYDVVAIHDENGLGFAASTGNTGRILRFSAEDPATPGILDPIYQIEPDGTNFYGGHLAAIGALGSQDVLVGGFYFGSPNFQAHRISHDGNQIWSQPLNYIYIGAIQSIPDITGDGKPDVVIGSDHLIAVNGETGSLIWRNSNIRTSNSSEFPTMLLGKTSTGNGIFVSANDTLSNTSAIYLFDIRTGTKVWEYPVVFAVMGFQIVNMDSDPNSEILVSYYGGKTELLDQ